MNASMLTWVWLAPLLALPFAGLRSGKWLLPLAPLPALWIALYAPEGIYLDIPWLLLGSIWSLDETGRTFLLVNSVMYFVAALYSIGRHSEEVQTRRYRAFFLLTMCGNLGLSLAQDMASFYAGFSLMSLCAYGILKPSRTQTSRQAARWYLSMAILGEVALLTAAIILNFAAGGLAFADLQNLVFPTAAVLLVILSFGVKLGIPGLHMWMPLTYMAAPAVSVIVLSSAMLNAGVLGLLRFLPPGNAHLLSWGEFLIGVGAVATVFGILIGLLQANPRALLAYSSISKTGTMILGVGIALNSPAAAPLIASAIVLYAAHHALVKGALFLATHAQNSACSVWVFPALCFLALALAEAPLTSGAAAKYLFKDAIPQAWHALESFLSVAGFATALLMGRFLYLIWTKHDAAKLAAKSGLSMVVSLAPLLIIIAVLPFQILPLHKLSGGAVSITLAIGLVLAFWKRPPGLLQKFKVELPPGDIIVLLRLGYAYVARQFERLVYAAMLTGNRRLQMLRRVAQDVNQYSTAPLERVLRYWEVAGALWLALSLGFIVLLL